MFYITHHAMLIQHATLPLPIESTAVLFLAKPVSIDPSTAKECIHQI